MGKLWLWYSKTKLLRYVTEENGRGVGVGGERCGVRGAGDEALQLFARRRTGQ